jgi:hypothetical protein
MTQLAKAVRHSSDDGCSASSQSSVRLTIYCNSGPNQRSRTSASRGGILTVLFIPYRIALMEHLTEQAREWPYARIFLKTPKVIIPGTNGIATATPISFPSPTLSGETPVKAKIEQLSISAAAKTCEPLGLVPLPQGHLFSLADFTPIESHYEDLLSISTIAEVTSGEVEPVFCEM